MKIKKISNVNYYLKLNKSKKAAIQKVIKN
jgi:hypothetical protein